MKSFSLKYLEFKFYPNQLEISENQITKITKILIVLQTQIVSDRNLYWSICLFVRVVSCWQQAAGKQIEWKCSIHLRVKRFRKIFHFGSKVALSHIFKCIKKYQILKWIKNSKARDRKHLIWEGLTHIWIKNIVLFNNRYLQEICRKTISGSEIGPRKGILIPFQPKSTESSFLRN